MTVAKLQHDKLYMTRRQLAAADDLVSDNLYLQGICGYNVGEKVLILVDGKSQFKH